MNTTTRTFTLTDAIALATEAHAGVLDKAGVPYIAHPLRVMEMCAAAGYSEEVQMAAVLHDTVEDVFKSLTPLRTAGAPEDVIAMVDAVSRREGPQYPGGKEPYQSGLIARAAVNDGARVIKLFDNGHNSLPRRTVFLGAKQAEMGRTRYTPARATLLAVEAHRRRGGLPGTFPTNPDEFLAYAIHLDDLFEAANQN